MSDYSKVLEFHEKAHKIKEDKSIHSPEKSTDHLSKFLLLLSGLGRVSQHWEGCTEILRGCSWFCKGVTLFFLTEHKKNFWIFLGKNGKF